MMINIKDVLTLDNNEQYIVISKAIKDDKTYYYLLNKNDLNDIKFCYEDSDDLVEVNDKDLITKLLPIFLEAITEHDISF